MCSCSGRRAEGWRRRGSVRCSSPSCGTWPRAAPSSPHCARIGIERSRTAPSFSFAPSAASAMISCPPSRRSSLSRTVSGASSPAITWKSSSPKARPPQRADRQAGSARDLGEARGLRQRAHGGGAAPVRRRGKTLSPNADKLDDAALVRWPWRSTASDAGRRRSRCSKTTIERMVSVRSMRSACWAAATSGNGSPGAWLRISNARALYDEGLKGAVAGKDHAQAYYHAINLAFLDLMAASATDGVPAKVRDMAEQALKHCAAAKEDHWRLATEAEAALMLEDLPKAKELYKRALAKATSERDRDSMYSQAVRLAQRVFGEDGVKEIAALTGLQ